MRDDNSTLPCCFCLVQLNQLPCSYCLLCMRKHIACGCLPTVSACLFEIISPGLWEILFSSLLSLSMWFPPAEKDSLPVLVSLIFHLFCSNLFSRSVGAQLGREGNKNYILVRCAGWIVRRLVRRSTEPSLGMESQECVADLRVKLWVLSEMGLVTKVQKPCRKKKSWKEN